MYRLSSCTDHSEQWSSTDDFLKTEENLGGVVVFDYLFNSNPKVLVPVFPRRRQEDLGVFLSQPYFGLGKLLEKQY